MKGLVNSICMAIALLGLATAFACPYAVRAQDGVRGSFVLPFEVQWQGKTLPAGEYHFMLRSNIVKGRILLLRDAQDLHNIMLIGRAVGGGIQGPKCANGSQPQR